MKKCPSCGVEVEKSTPVCPVCGFDIEVFDTLTLAGVFESASLDSEPETPRTEDLAQASEEDAPSPVATRDSAEEPIASDESETFVLDREQQEVSDRLSTKSVLPENLLDPEARMTAEERERVSHDAKTHIVDVDDRHARRTLVTTGKRAPLVGQEIPDREIGNGDWETDVDGEPDYRLVKEVGRGAAGIVYHATQTSLNRNVAIKMLAKQKRSSKENRKTNLKDKDIKKFMYESQITARLDHPNIITVHDMGKTSQDTLFFSMKLLEGSEWQTSVRTKSLEENLKIFDAICDGMRFAHSQGIIHRDLKPENVLVGTYGEVQVSDWGLAIHLQETEADSLNAGGTPCFMAPEMALHFLSQMRTHSLREKILTASDDEKKALHEKLRAAVKEEKKWQSKIGPTSDVYVLAAILFNIATGSPPHSYHMTREDMERWKKRRSDIRAQKELELAAGGKISEPPQRTTDDQVARNALEQIARDVMQRDPDQRIQSVAQLQRKVAEFQELIQSLSVTERGNRELDSAEQEKDSYQGYANAIYAYDEAISLWSENDMAREGHAKATYRYADRALHKKDFDLGLSLMTQDAIALQPDQKKARTLRNELFRQKKRRDRLKTAFWSVSALATVLVILAIPAAVTIWNAQASIQAAEIKKQQAIEGEEKANKAREDAQEAEQKAITAEKIAKDAAEVAVKEKEDAEKAEEAARLREKEARDAEKIAKDAEAAAIVEKDKAQEAEKSAKLAEANALKGQEVAENAANAAKQQAEVLALKNKLKQREIALAEQEAQMGVYLSRVAGVTGALENLDITGANKQIEELFASDTVPNSTKNSWEIHYQYKRANPQGTRFDLDNHRLKQVVASADGSVLVGVQYDNQVGTLHFAEGQCEFRPLALGRDLRNVTSIHLTDDGRWLSVIENEPEDPTRLPIVYDLRQQQVAFAAEPEHYTFAPPQDSQASEAKPTFHFGGQAISLFANANNQFTLFTVDQHVDKGINLYRCAALELVLQADGTMVAKSTPQMVKVPGTSLNKGLSQATLESGDFIGRDCVVSMARRAGDTSIQVAIAVRYPTHNNRMPVGVFVFDFATVIDKLDDDHLLDARQAQALPLMPTRMLLSAGEASDPTPLHLFVGSETGALVNFPCRLAGQGFFALDSENAKSLEGHRTAITALHRIANSSTMYSSSQSELMVWNVQTGESQKRLLGHQGSVRTMTAYRDARQPSNEQTTKLISVANSNEQSELRVWKPGSSEHDWVRRLDSAKDQSPYITGTMDLAPNSQAVAYAKQDGSLGYFNPQSSEVAIGFHNPRANRFLASLKDAHFGLFGDRWLTVYDGAGRMFVWDLTNTNQRDPMIYGESVGTVSERSFFSASHDGTTIVTSHPTKSNHFIKWSLNPANGEMLSQEVSLAGSERAVLEPFVTPDGQWILLAKRLRLTFAIQIYAAATFQKEAQPVEEFSAGSYERFRSLSFSPERSEILVVHDQRGVMYTSLNSSSDEDTAQQRRTTQLAGMKLQLNEGRWEQIELEFPEQINKYSQLLFNDWHVQGERELFVGTGRDKSGKTQMLVWNAEGVQMTQPTTYSRRSGAQFSQDGNAVRFLDTGELQVWPWLEQQERQVDARYANQMLRRWKRLSEQFLLLVANDSFVVVKDREGVTAASEPVFQFSLVNAPVTLALHGPHLFAQHEDGSLSLTTVGDSSSQSYEIEGRHAMMAVSPDGTQLATVSADGERTLLYDVAAIKEGNGRPGASLDVPASHLNWISSQLAERIGLESDPSASYQLVTATHVDDKLELRGWASQLENERGRIDLSAPQGKSLKHLEIASRSGSVMTAAWQDGQLSVWQSSRDNDSAIHWVPVTTDFRGKVNHAAISEVSDEFGGSDVAPRIAVSLETPNGQSVRIYMLKDAEAALEEVQFVERFQVRDQVVATDFSGSGKTLGAVTQDKVILWLTDGWDAPKVEMSTSAADLVTFTEEEIQKIREQKTELQISDEEIDRLPVSNQ